MRSRMSSGTDGVTQRIAILGVDHVQRRVDGLEHPEQALILGVFEHKSMCWV